MRKLLFISLIGSLLFLGAPGDAAADLVKIRMGYQSLWSPIAEIYSVLRHTDILKKNGLEGEFQSFSYAGPMAEAIGAGLIDTAYGGWMPTLTFFKAGPDWKFVSQIVEYGWFIVVREPDKLRTFEDLKGKTLGVPFGALVQFMAIRQIRKYGFKLDKDVMLVNVGPGALAGALQAKAVDGIVAWHPLHSNAISLGLGKLLPLKFEATVIGTQAISGDFIKNHRDAAVGFLKALTMAFSYASKNRDKVIGWYLDDHPQIKVSKTLIATAWDVDRYLRKPTDVKDVDLRLTKKDLDFGQGVADLAHSLKFLPKKFDVRALTDSGLMERAYKELQAAK